MSTQKLIHKLSPIGEGLTQPGFGGTMDADGKIIEGFSSLILGSVAILYGGWLFVNSETYPQVVHSGWENIEWT